MKVSFSRICLIILACSLAILGYAGHRAWAKSPQWDQTSLRLGFDEGNRLYGEGDYEGAIEAYSELVDRGVEETDLYYNLGNAFFKNGELGKAVLFYERALRLSPRAEDAKDNLALVESMLRDRQFIRSENRLKKALVWVDRNLNTGETIVFVSLFYLLFCLFAVVYIFRKTVFVTSLYRRLSIFSPGRFVGLTREQDLLLVSIFTLFLFLLSGASAYQKVSREKRHDRAVVIEQETAVYSGPTDDSTLQFKIHEGTRTVVRMKRLGWVQIDLPGDLSGWVRDGAIEEI